MLALCTMQGLQAETSISLGGKSIVEKDISKNLKLSNYYTARILSDGPFQEDAPQASTQSLGIGTSLSKKFDNLSLGGFFEVDLKVSNKPLENIKLGVSSKYNIPMKYCSLDLENKFALNAATGYPRYFAGSDIYYQTLYGILENKIQLNVPITNRLKTYVAQEIPRIAIYEPGENTYKIVKDSNHKSCLGLDIKLTKNLNLDLQYKIEYGNPLKRELLGQNFGINLITKL